ncbi:Alcohol dehydrogenase [acceptor] [BD1-7 clade bacterium]|uniref:Alcohol dehydrogenase [acceptor] n=1 Tax=BD1-7 clade bacterium TaxID=2029982 RepID=A0A5S9MVB2_9GAMM|nr:Alcohol dehydrogenase [acceptor] [BD1-7 clade bacterium]CAA0083320.1 Alcohol dehydrogenase [acceptor] [BD1-7 clade bacterium]
MTDQTFDYIVVGAGSAGAVVANRLVKAGKKTLLVEAGPADLHPMIHMPGGAQEVIKSKKLNWFLDSEPQEHLNNRRMMQHRGKMLGGSSNINGMVAIRGNKADYDQWASLGNDGWDYQSVLTNFKNIENWCDTDNAYHSSKGDLPINKTLGENPLFETFIEAGLELGYAPNDDFNGETQYGVGRYHANIKDGQRWGTSRTFVTPLKGNPNFTIETNMLVEKVLIEGNCAVGIQCSRKGKSFTFKANHEVVLSGGAFNSPQLLMLSGIGPKQKLDPLGIDVVKDLPGVGENLQDHLSFLFNYGCKEPITINGPATNPIKQVGIALNYFIFKRGLGAVNSIESGAFMNSHEGLDAPDIQLHFVPTLMYNLTDDLPKEHGVSVRACNLTPHSRGYVDIVSADPKAKPRIDFRFLSDERDIPPLLEAYKIVQKWMQANAWNGLMTEEKKGAMAAKTDEERMEFVREYIETDYHPVGTCKMGNDDQAVVDAQLKVHGIEGLRVADASIMPTIVRGNTNIPCMMIGDKCAELILAS